MIWQEFEVHLFSTIINFTARTILIIGASNEQGKTGVPFAQFAGINALYGGNTDLVAAICGENVPEDMATFTPQQRDDLQQLGFTPSDDGMTCQRGRRLYASHPRTGDQQPPDRRWRKPARPPAAPIRICSEPLQVRDHHENETGPR